MPTAVVTGGAGFLGSHLCDYLVADGLRVICVDNLATGSLQNIEHLHGDQFRFLNHDLTEHFDIDESVDFVFHLASPASPIDYLRLPLQTLKVGSYGTHNALGLAKFKRARFLLASTSEVYGDPRVHPQPETYWGNVNPIGPRGVYDEAKRYAEALTMAYHRQQGVDTCIVRIFNTYGTRMRPHDGRAIPTFVRPGARERAADRIRRRLADAQLLLRRRSRSAVSSLLATQRRAPAGQHRQPAGAHAPRARRDGDPRHGLEERDRVRGVARRRSAGAPARHHPGSAAAGLGAAGQPRGRAAADAASESTGVTTCLDASP